MFPRCKRALHCLVCQDHGGSSASDLLQSDVLDPPAFVAQEVAQKGQQLSADVGRGCRKIEQNAAAIFKDMKAEAIVPVERRQRPVDRPDATAISLLVAGCAHEDGDLLGGVICGDVPVSNRHV